MASIIGCSRHFYGKKYVYAKSDQMQSAYNHLLTCRLWLYRDKIFDEKL